MDSVTDIAQLLATSVLSGIVWLKFALLQLGVAPSVIVALAAAGIWALLPTRKPYRVYFSRVKFRALNWICICSIAVFAIYVAVSEALYRMPYAYTEQLRDLVGLQQGPQQELRSRHASLAANFSYPHTEKTIRAAASSIRVIDADTIQIQSTRVRLDGIAAPEKGHRTYEPGRRFLRRLFAGASRIECRLTGERTYNREVGYCIAVIDGASVDIQAEVVLAGLARDCAHYSRYRYRTLEGPDSRRLPLPRYC